MTPEPDIFDVLAKRPTPRVVLCSDPPSGLRAIIALDDTTLGTAVGGTRLRAYPSTAAAIDDAAHLARAMTLKCALGGVDAGGGKMVIMDHPGLQREAAFERLGGFVEELGGRFFTAGDLGTTARDVELMARHSSYVYTDEASVVASVARGLVGCVRACVEVAERVLPDADADRPLAGLRVAVQGCGAIGVAAARALTLAGAHLLVADIDRERASELARAVAGEVVAPDQVLLAEVDVICPCAAGGAITPGIADRLRAWAVCGAANNILSEIGVAETLLQRGILHVPDVIASAGGVIDGVGVNLMGLGDRGPLIDQLGDTAKALLLASRETGRTTEALAIERAWARIRAHRSKD